MSETPDSASLTERERFEKWARMFGMLLEHKRNSYASDHTALIWEGWQARAALSASQPAPEPPMIDSRLTDEQIAELWNKVCNEARILGYGQGIGGLLMAVEEYARAIEAAGAHRAEPLREEDAHGEKAWPLADIYQNAFDQFAGPERFRHGENSRTYHRAGLIAVWNAALSSVSPKPEGGAEPLREALEAIAKVHNGLDINSTPEERARYWSGLCREYRRIARTALSSVSPKGDKE